MEQRLTNLANTIGSHDDILTSLTKSSEASRIALEAYSADRNRIEGLENRIHVIDEKLAALQKKKFQAITDDGSKPTAKATDDSTAAKVTEHDQTLAQLANTFNNHETKTNRLFVIKDTHKDLINEIQESLRQINPNATQKTFKDLRKDFQQAVDQMQLNIGMLEGKLNAIAEWHGIEVKFTQQSKQNGGKGQSKSKSKSTA